MFLYDAYHLLSLHASASRLIYFVLMDEQLRLSAHAVLTKLQFINDKYQTADACFFCTGLFLCITC